MNETESTRVPSTGTPVLATVLTVLGMVAVLGVALAAVTWPLGILLAAGAALTLAGGYLAGKHRQG